MTAPLPNPRRVAIIGAGPAGFYAAEQLLRADPDLAVDMFDRLPTPYGLVRAGVAPDHQKIKTVTRPSTRRPAHPRFRFFGGVEFGRDIDVDDLRAPLPPGRLHDRRPDRPAHGHPRRRPAGQPPRDRVRRLVQRPPRLSGLQFDLSRSGWRWSAWATSRSTWRASSCRTAGRAGGDRHRRLRARGAASEPRTRGVPARPARPGAGRLHQPRDQGAGRARRRGPHQSTAEAELDPLSAEEVERSGDRRLRKVAMLQEYAAPPAAGQAASVVVLRFLVSPTRTRGRRRWPRPGDAPHAESPYARRRARSPPNRRASRRRLKPASSSAQWATAACPSRRCRSTSADGTTPQPRRPRPRPRHGSAPSPASIVPAG